ncbi:MAG: hypothetical protein HZB51_09035 [Chloroflexi bacterium]|nr:hypothetical protein [Chloroflexota bacterium]
MKTRMTRMVTLAVVLLGFVLLGAQTSIAQAQNVSPEKFLNDDGTLNLDGTFNGSLDLSGWNVQLDPTRGPVFNPGSSQPAAPSAAGAWSNLGSGLAALNGSVEAIVVCGTDIYIGGFFTDANDIPEADYIVKWNGNTWSALGSNGAGNGALNSWVKVIAVSGSNVYVGGDFTDVNNNGTVLTAADYIARWNGTNWSALGSNGASNGSLSYRVNAIAASGSNIYVGGQFQDVNNNGTVLTAADYVARWDGTRWWALGSNGAGNGSITNPVYAIAIFWTDVYVGGAFYDVNNNGTVLTAADFIAKWNGTTWSALSSNGAGHGSLSYTVHAIAVGGTSLYVGGQFQNVNNNGTVLPTADFIARWDGTNWSALGSNGAGNGAVPGGAVTAIAANATTVYIGGDFWDVGNTAGDRIAKWDGSTWSALGSDGAGDGSLNNTVYAIAISGSNVYAGGWFENVNNNGTLLSAATYFATWNGSVWSAPAATTLNGSLSNYFNMNPYVNAIAVSGTNVYVGGYFVDVQNGATALPAADYVARWDALTGNWNTLGSDGAGNGSLNGMVFSLAVSGSNVYVGGIFTNVNNNGTLLNAADYVAKYDTLTGNWSALGSNGAGDGSLNSGVYAIAVSGSNVYVGGAFQNVNNKGTVLTAADFIARWDTSSGNWFSLLGDGISNGSLNMPVRAIAASGSIVYVGGDFVNVNNGGTVLNAADHIAIWDALASNWSALGSNGAGDGSLNGSRVYAIAVSASNLYVGGDFTNVNNNGIFLNAADYIAKWDTLTGNWSALSQNGAGNGALNGEVRAISITGSDLYVGGGFTDVNDRGNALPTADYVAKWDGTNWSALGGNGAGNGALNGWVNALAMNGSKLYAGGGFSNVNNNGTRLTAADYIAAYDSAFQSKLYLPLIVR